MNLYVHVPFCARRCSYCDFAIAVRPRVPSQDFVEAILQEWAGVQEDPGWDASPALDTIYLGGGTPSRLDPAAVATLLEGLQRRRALASGAEVTLEANPDDVSPAAARAWRAAGVNRVSLGVQSFDPAVLAWMHRTHTAEQSRATVALLRDAGIANLSLDLIYALPAPPARDWDADLEAAFALAPDHLSCYGLSVEPRTPLGRWTARGESPGVDEGRYASEFLRFHSALEARGWEHYEVSNAARPGFRARHNAGYWTGAPYLGLGPSAHSATGGERRWNLREYTAWRAALAEGRATIEGRERLDEGQRRIEALYLGLRTAGGVPASLVPAAAGTRWKSSGWAREAEGRIVLTTEGWLRLDALVAEAA